MTLYFVRNISCIFDSTIIATLWYLFAFRKCLKTRKQLVNLTTKISSVRKTFLIGRERDSAYEVVIMESESIQVKFFKGFWLTKNVTTCKRCVLYS